jgi:hypothetical protein
MTAKASNHDSGHQQQPPHGWHDGEFAVDALIAATKGGCRGTAAAPSAKQYQPKHLAAVDSLPTKPLQRLQPSHQLAVRLALVTGRVARSNSRMAHTASLASCRYSYTLRLSSRCCSFSAPGSRCPCPAGTTPQQ